MPLCKDDTDVPKKYGSCAVHGDCLRSLTIFLARWHFLCRSARTTLTSQTNMDLVQCMETACGVSRYLLRGAFFMSLCKDDTDVPKKYGSCAVHGDCLRSLTIFLARSQFLCRPAITTLTSPKNMDLVPCMRIACGVSRYCPQGGILLLRRLWKDIPKGEGHHIKKSPKAPGQLPPLLSPSGRMVRALVVRKSCQLRGCVLGGCVVSWPSWPIPRPPMYSFASAS